ncbi:hypothetical protein EV140_2578 [Microcella alkaliphila]|uniref:Transcriptional regulator, AbiEi antitoxin, Type IV TA system n=1 Tax=Microcella alkaliphila TaxID=279828 RepID=A0A4Q7TDD9_9MICO|nr:hypothetical protein EV140_2578 [Microcella alkaliphila]
MEILRQYADPSGLVRAMAVTDEGHRRLISREVARGRLVRVARGAYLPSHVWASLDEDARYRAIVHAAATGRLASDELICHRSAAALWRLPSFEPWPATVHTVRPARGQGRRNGIVVRHVSAQPDPGAEVDGLPVTSLARTVTDVASTESLANGLIAVDAALRGQREASWARPPLARELLVETAQARALNAGRTRALRVVSMGDPRSASAGESLLRATLHLLGIPPAEPQVRFVGDSGRVYYVDLYWPDQDFVLEFDGKGKYTDPLYMAGRSASEVVYEEKRREDEIRAQVRGMTRVDWGVAASPTRLERRLRAAGFVFP